MVTEKDIKFLSELIKNVANDVQLLRAYNIVLMNLLAGSDDNRTKSILKKVDSFHAKFQIDYLKDVDQLSQDIFSNPDENQQEE